jgi:hypothetical protein
MCGYYGTSKKDDTEVKGSYRIGIVGKELKDFIIKYLTIKDN